MILTTSASRVTVEEVSFDRKTRSATGSASANKLAAIAARKYISYVWFASFPDCLPARAARRSSRRRSMSFSSLRYKTSIAATDSGSVEALPESTRALC